MSTSVTCRYLLLLSVATNRGRSALGDGRTCCSTGAKNFGVRICSRPRAPPKPTYLLGIKTCQPFLLAMCYPPPDPRRMTLLPAKPNATTPADQPTAQQLAEAESTLSTLAGIKHAHQVSINMHEQHVGGRVR